MSGLVILVAFNALVLKKSCGETDRHTDK